MTGQSRRSGPDVHMNHFTLGEWADFVWRLQDPSVTAQMQQHLDESCRKCSRIVRSWHHLFDFGSKEGLHSPPDRALRSVRGYYGLLKPGGRGSRVATMARLLFDSLLEPVSVGIRSSQLSPRHLVYSAGDVLIDLRLEHRSGRVYLVGQAQPHAANRQVAGIDVLALKRTQKVAQTTCIRFGEFQFDLESEEDEGFFIVRKGPKLIVIPLPGLRSLRGNGSKS